MITKKRLLKIFTLYLVIFVASTAGFYFFIVVYGQKTFYLNEKQWHPAEPETQHIDPFRLTKALDYADRRLPTARSLLMLRNGKTVAEKYYWQGGSKVTDYLHSMNLPLLQMIIGIAIDHQLIRGRSSPYLLFSQNI